MWGNFEQLPVKGHQTTDKTRRRHRSVAAVGAIALSLALAGPAEALQGDCSQPLSTGTSPTASDCLFILKAAVGLVTCTPECICEPKGSGPITATDALFCLKKAVGQPVTLQCPCVVTTSTSSTTTTSTSSTSTSTTMPGPINSTLSVWVKKKSSSYAQSDMAGNWWLESITAGFGSPDWSRGSLTIQNNGTFSGSFTDIDGTPENVSGAKITMAADGSFTCDLCSALFRGTLDSGGTVAAITDTWDDGTVELLMALRKAPNYAQSDLTGAWKVNELLSPFPGWTRGDFTIQSNGALGGAVVTSSGENVTPSGTVTVMGDGTASCTGCGTTNFRGVLDADKTVGVATYGDPVNEQEMNILLRPAASPSQSDIAGTWHVNVITSGQDPGWMRGEVMVGANGVLSGMLAVSDNSQQPAMGTLTVAPDGTITHSLVPDMLCVLDSGKTVMVCTNSN